MSEDMEEATAAQASAGEEAAMFGVIDLAVLLGLLVLIAGLSLRWWRNKKQKNTVRKLSVVPKSVY